MEQIVANGLYLGAQYALIALGLTLIFSLMNVLNFAHGQMYVFGGFITYTIVAQFKLPFIVGLFASAGCPRSSSHVHGCGTAAPSSSKPASRRKRSRHYAIDHQRRVQLGHAADHAL